MTVFIKHSLDWMNLNAIMVENYVEWLVANIGPNHRTSFGEWNDWYGLPLVQQTNSATRWGQLCDNYWALREQVVDSKVLISSLKIHYGTGWHVMHMRGHSGPYQFDDDIVVSIYDELLAIQFKLTCL